MWRSLPTRPSSNPDLVGLRPAGGEKFAVGRTFSGQSYKRFVSLAMYFTLPRWLNWVPSNLWIVSVSDSVVAPARQHSSWHCIPLHGLYLVRVDWNMYESLDTHWTRLGVIWSGKCQWTEIHSWNCALLICSYYYYYYYY